MKKEASAVLVALFGMVASAATLTWTGGSTGNLSDASWTDGTSQGLTPQSGDKLVFGTAGAFVYDLDAAVWLERLEFSASVTLTGGEISTAVYVSNGGFIVSDASGDARVVTIDVPVKFKTGDMMNSSSVCVKRRQDVLEFAHGIGGYARWLTISGSNLGTIRWHKDETSFTSDYTRIYGGTNELWGGSFSSSDLRFVADATDSHKMTVRFMGGEYAASVSVSREAAAEVYPIFVADTVSTFKRVFKASTTWGMSMQVQKGADIVFEKGLQKVSSNTRVPFKLAGGNTLTFNGPIQVADDGMNVPGAFLCQSSDPNDTCVVVLNAATNYFSQVTKGTGNLSGLVLQGNVVLKTQVEDAFAAEPYPVQLWLQDKGSFGGVIDLCGHNQHVGSLLQFSKDGIAQDGEWVGGHSGFRSEEPATVYVCQNATGSSSFTNITWPGRFWGRASLEKSGANPLTLSNVSSTTGTLAVAEGVLKFAESGGWPNCTGVYVKGGELVVDKAGRLPRKIDWHLSAAGKLSISDGVNIVAKQAWFTDAEGHETQASPGRYTAQNAPDYIKGEGSLTVVGGLMLIFR